MIPARPGEPFEATTPSIASGLVGTLGVRVMDGQDHEVVARATTGIVESPAGSGLYTATITAPPTTGQYSVVWDTGGAVETWGTEDLYVSYTAPTTPWSPNGHYAVIADVRGYTILAAGVSDQDLQTVLERAERDVDGELVEPYTWSRVESTGLKYDPVALEMWRAAALNRATCAQTEYRLSMGEEFFVRAQHTTERGPDFSVSGQLPYIGPKVYRELAGAVLVATPGIGQLTVGGTITSSSWYGVQTNAD